MKTIYTLLAVLLAHTFFQNLHAQRYIPLLEEGQSFIDSYEGPNERVQDMIVYNDMLLIAGDFTMVNDEQMFGLVYWDGSSYQPFDVPLTSEHQIFDVLETPLGLVISGDFEADGNIKLFDGTQWTNLGDGFDGRVLDIIWHNDQLYACGEFSNSGLNTTSHIAYYNGSEWIQEGAGLDDDARAMIEFDSELHVGGSFEYSGGTELNHIAKLSGDSWQPVHTGLDDVVNALAIFNDELFIGGSIPFTSGYLAKNNADSFVILAEDIDGQVASLVPASEGLFVSTVSSFSFDDDIDDTALFTDEGLENINYYLPGLSVVISHDGTRYCNSQKLTDTDLEENFFVDAKMGKLKHSGELSVGVSTNQISTDLSLSATQFNDRITGRANYHVSPFDNVSSVYAAAPWMGGLIENDEILINAQTYGEYGEDNFFYFGPMSDSYDEVYLEKYLRVWKVSALEIEDHIANYSNADYEMPEAIQYWPGNGRVEHGESSHIAPFIDTNQNGWYEPEEGDYPDIKGDVAIFNILSGSRRGAYQEGETKLEIGVLAYGYLTADSDLDHTLFLKYSILNNSTDNYSDFKLGAWTDFDLGTPIDDYVGCAPQQDLFYVYNGDPVDESSSSSLGFGENPPAHGVKFLNRSMGSFLYHNIGPGLNGDPSTPFQHWNYMNSIWKNGDPVTYGGDGFQTANDPDNPTSFMFPSNPNDDGSDPDAWNELTAGNDPGDRRGIGATESMTLAAGERICVEFAHITAFNDNEGELPAESVNALLEKAAQVQAFYDAQTNDCFPETFVLDIEETNLNSQITIYPNPATESLFISGLTSERVDVVIIDLEGRTILSEANVSGNAQIDISTLASGMYIIATQKDNSMISTNRFVKQ
ncbi:MAG: T9SS type A sorting domain-containing protein [Flavobacteriales bacterium]